MNQSQNQKPKSPDKLFAFLTCPYKRFKVYWCWSLGSDHSDLFDFCKFPFNSLNQSMASISASPRTVEDIFKDYSARRTGLVRALTYGDLDLSLFYLFSLMGPFFWMCLRNWVLDFDLPFRSSLADVDEFYSLCDPGECSFFWFC